MKKKVIVNSVEETKKLAQKIGELCQQNDVITLNGDLGAGKTTFTQGLALGLKITKTISSPTFTLLKIYQGRLPLYHFDAYRLEGSREYLGFEEMIDGDGVAVIEWPKYIEQEIPKSRLNIIISNTGEFTREILLEATSLAYERFLNIEV